jgi:hypothetical protein
MSLDEDANRCLTTTAAIRRLFAEKARRCS